MVRVTMLSRGDRLCGFRICGHAGGEWGTDIVCAALSSAALLAANTVTDVCGCHAVTRMRDGYLLLSVAERDLDRCGEILRGLGQHVQALQRQYPEKIQLGTVSL